jgi:1-acyl-sn-glycerol-3-phosphate acyltransferase
MSDFANKTKYWVYEGLRVCIASAARFYFRRTAVLHAERVPQEGPVFLLCNHPNALTDPIVAACFSERQVYFLTRGDLFQKPLVNWIFRSLKMLPIYRQKDGGDTVSRNLPTFNETADILQHGGCAVIMPEATISKRRSLRPFKTGAARISLDVQARFGTEKKLTIIPVNVTYRDPYHSGGDFVITYGEPVYCDDLLALHHQDEEAAFVTLTTRFEEKMREMALHLPADDLYEARAACYDLFVKMVLPEAKTSEALADNWMREKQFCEALNNRALNEDVEDLAGALRDWLARGVSMGIPNDGAFAEAPSAQTLWTRAAAIFITAPLAAASWLPNAPGLAVHRYFLSKVRDVEFHPSITFFCATLVTPATYVVESLLVSLAFGPLLGLGFLCLCPLSFVVWYQHRKHRKQWTLSRTLYEARARGEEVYTSWRSELRSVIKRVSALTNE